MSEPEERLSIGKSIGFAIALLVFLMLSFRLAGDPVPSTNAESGSVISQTDSVISTLNQPEAHLPTRP